MSSKEYSDVFEFEIPHESEGLRIDKYLNLQLDEASRSYIQKLIKDGDVLLNGSTVKSNYKVRPGDMAKVCIPMPSVLDVLPEDIPLEIIYEDADILLVNKPKGMVVHPSPGHYSGTLVNALMYHCRDHLSTINGVMRPGIVHRIDKDTTGILVVCKNDASHQCLAAQLKEHSITRRYEAVVYNNFKEDTGLVDAPIGRMENDRKKMAVNEKHGRKAITHYKVLERFGKYTHIQCQLETGRTHQIRVHMASIGHPLLGDTVYGPVKPLFGLEGQTLHAGTLGFVHPSTKAYMEFSVPLPDYFAQLLSLLKDSGAYR